MGCLDIYIRVLRTFSRCLDYIFLRCCARDLRPLTSEAVGCLHFKCSASFGPSHIVRLDLNMIYMECLGLINFRKSLCTPHVSKFLFSKHHLLPCVNRRSAWNLQPHILILWVKFKIFLDAVIGSIHIFSMNYSKTFLRL